MNKDAISPLVEAITAIKSGDSTGKIKGQLQAALRAVADIPARLPDWLISTEKRTFEDIDNILDNLSNLIHILYNKYGQVGIMAPDLFLTHAGFERIGMHSQCAIYTASRGVRSDSDDLCSLEAIFIQVEREMPSDLEVSFPSIILLCPSQFNSAQLAWIIDRRRNDSNVLLLDTDQADEIALSIRKNDKKKLDFLVARWELEKEATARDAQLKGILAHLEDIAREVENGTGK